MIGPLLSRWLATPVAPTLPEIDLPTERLAEIGWLDALLAYPPFKALVPVPIIAALAPVVVLFFGKTWRKLDAESLQARQGDQDAAAASGVSPPPAPATAQSPARGKSRLRLGVRAGAQPRGAVVRRHLLRRPPNAQILASTEPAPPSSHTTSHFDYRPAVCFVTVALVLTLQEYYGGRQFYGEVLRPWLEELESTGWAWVQVKKYDELWGFTWWSSSRIAGYTVIPLTLWKFCFPHDRILDMGLRIRGLRSHLWIYLLCLAVVVPAMFVVASQPDFGGYYPFYKNSSRSWFDLLIWEAMYCGQFFALELFFRGFMLGALRKSMGSAAIFAMALPYCMIHYGKPYLETNGAIVAGVVLGSLAMHTRSIYSGFLLHITVAFLMDFLSLWKRSGIPTRWFAP